jgi:hypothetical protein
MQHGRVEIREKSKELTSPKFIETGFGRIAFTRRVKFVTNTMNTGKKTNKTALRRQEDSTDGGKAGRCVCPIR